MAADRGVRVFAVGFGAAAGGAVPVDGMSIYMQFDEETLKAIAQISKGEYFHASSAAELKKVYSALTARFVLEKNPIDRCSSLAKSWKTGRIAW